MSGAWGNAGGVSALKSTAAPLTPEQQQANRLAEAERKAREAAAALRKRAEDLRDKVEGCITGGGNISSNYIYDDQFTVAGRWKTTEVTLAFDLWKQLHEARQRGSVVTLRIHMMGPSAKYSGGRDGQVQANFIRNKGGAKKGRYNVHINVNG
ncbi:hypothetical protein [Roseomonas sp. HF4]|uniref:hypothetical protein n=1 Tax=Roseomonas sp. HF4 TaxID=2562313 RepID=UPI0014859B86|nr:hypothetical protein [Roseomonas sp. HF4]